jgi:hypothetical protein
MRSRGTLLPMALAVGALLFLPACPRKTGGGTGGADDSSEEPAGPKPIHNVVGDKRVWHERHTKISLPRLQPPGGGRALPRFLEDQRHTAGSRSGTPW